MNLRQRQSGMSIPGMLLIAIMAGFYVMCAIKLAPVYFEYLSIKEILSTASSEYRPGTTTTGQLRRTIDKRFNTNQIYVIKSTDVETYRKNGKTFIDGSYEARLPIVWRIDAVMRFDDLLFQAGQPEPL